MKDEDETNQGKSKARAVLLFVIACIALFSLRMEARLVRFMATAEKPFVDTALTVTEDPRLTFVTLSYGASAKKDDKARAAPQILTHNCLTIKNTRHKFVVYTDVIDNTTGYCQHCQCERFVKYDCPCPIDNCTGIRNACEKNHLFSDLLAKHGEFAYLDYDLAIVKPAFVDAFYARTRHFDFLASRTHGPGMCGKYRKDFNSGLVFIRRIPTVDPMLLREYMYKNNTQNFDQGPLSNFIQDQYKNWDELNIKWHCRRMNDKHNSEVPLDHCYTMHPPAKGLLKRINFTLLVEPQ